MPVVFARNRALQHGGGYYQEGCDTGLEGKGLCWVGSTPSQPTAAFALSFQENQAAGAGGAIYTTCYSLENCADTLKLSLGLPTKATSGVLSFLSNTAKGYGHDIATAPNEIIATEHGQHYVPGHGILNVTLVLVDAKGQRVAGSGQTPIQHMIQVVVVPVSADCSAFETCQQLKLQPTESFLSSGGSEGTTQFAVEKMVLQFCQVGQEHVVVKFFVSATAARLDVAQDWRRLQASVRVACQMCPAGWTRQETLSETSGTLWTCRRCDDNFYVIGEARVDVFE